jgi:peptidoglycan/LPS O-acetylase OafA/YrhL
MLATANTPKRYDFPDWLRVIAILVLLFFHTGMIFVGWGWHIVNTETIGHLEKPPPMA